MNATLHKAGRLHINGVIPPEWSLCWLFVGLGIALLVLVSILSVN